MLNLKNSQELNLLMKNTKCLIIKFSASWCGPCKNKDFVNSYYQLKEKMKNNSDVVFLELDVDKNVNLVEDKKLEFNIKSIPIIKIYYKGKIMNEYVGIDCINKVDTDIDKILTNY